MLELVLKFHGGMRWLLVLVAAIAVVKFGLGLVRRAEFKGMDRGLMAAFVGLIDLNALFGLVLLVKLGETPMSNRIEHATTMILVFVAAHSSAFWRRSEDSAKKFRGNLIVVLLALLLIVVGVIRLRGGWLF